MAATDTPPPLRTRTLDHCLACGSRDLTRLPMRYEFRGVTFPAAECRALRATMPLSNHGTYR